MIERRTFPNAAAVVADARAFVASRVGDSDQELLRKVSLMVSELATNAVRHTTSDFTVEIERTTEHLCVRVSDSGGGEPMVRSPAADEPSGRGLQLVNELADGFGIDHEAVYPRTKTVWFLIRLDAGRPARSEDTENEPKARPLRVPRHEDLGTSLAKDADEQEDQEDDEDGTNADVHVIPFFRSVRSARLFPRPRVQKPAIAELRVGVRTVAP